MTRAETGTGPQPVRIAVVIPAGPRDDIADTLDSVLRYTDPSRVVVIVADTPVHPEPVPDVRVMQAGQARPGTQGGLWVKTAPAYRWILRNYQPGLVLRLDADALILGPGLEAAAVSYTHLTLPTILLV